MSLWTLVKIVAGLVVLAVVVFTLLLLRHVRHEPMDGIFAELVPVTMEAAPLVSLPEPSADLPEIDPGAKVFERAREMIAIGDLASGREKLRTVVTLYPQSKAAPEARRIVGEMNLDEVFSAGHMEGKQVHVVARGESYLGISAKYGTSLDMLMHLNGLMDLRSLHPGDELVVLPLDFKVLIEPKREALSIWDDGRFIKDFRILRQAGAPSGDQKTKIDSRVGMQGEKRVIPGGSGYRESAKVITLERLPHQIGVLPADAGEADELPQGFYLSAEDLEELAILLRPGNEVEIRTSAR